MQLAEAAPEQGLGKEGIADAAGCRRGRDLQQEELTRLPYLACYHSQSP